MQYNETLTISFIHSVCIVFLQMIRLEPGNDVWNAWSDVKAPIFLHAYVFNITNHEDVLNGETPKLVELGPYVYE